MHGTFTVSRRSNIEDLPVSFPVGPRWYVVRTNIGCEFRAQLGLASEGFRVFLPFITRWRRHARIATIGKAPLFPRYLFVEADWNIQSLHALHNTNGVESILNNNGVPASIYGDFIAFLIEKQLRGDFDKTQEEKLPLGARVAIMDGKYEDEIGYIEQYNGQKRADVLISIMGRRVRETLSLVNLRPAW